MMILMRKRSVWLNTLVFLLISYVSILVVGCATIPIPPVLLDETRKIGIIYNSSLPNDYRDVIEKGMQGNYHSFEYRGKFIRLPDSSLEDEVVIRDVRLSALRAQPNDFSEVLIINIKLNNNIKYLTKDELWNKMIKNGGSNRKLITWFETITEGASGYIAIYSIPLNKIIIKYNVMIDNDDRIYINPGLIKSSATLNEMKDAYIDNYEYSLNKIKSNLLWWFDIKIATTLKETLFQYAAYLEPPLLVANVKFDDSKGSQPNEALDAEEHAELILKIENQGKGTAYGVTPAMSYEARGFSIESLESFEMITAGGIKEIHVPVVGKMDLGDGLENIRLEVKEQRGNNAKPIIFPIQTGKLIPPDLMIIQDAELNDGKEGLTKGNSNGRLDAWERAELVLRVKNQGKGTAYDVTPQVSILEGKGFTLDKSYSLGTISAGESKEFRVPVFGGLELPTGWSRLQIEAVEKRGYDSNKLEVSFQTEQLKKPNLVIKSYRVNDGMSGLADGNSNGIVENSETAELEAFIENDGEGDAEGVKLSLVNITPGVKVLQRDSEIGRIGVGDTVKGKVVVQVPRDVQISTLEVKFRVEEVDRKAASAEKSFVLKTNNLKPALVANLEWSDRVVGNARGNGNGVWENGEIIEGMMTIFNGGSLDAEGVEVTLNPSGGGVNLESRQFQIGRLGAGQTSAPVRTVLTIPRTYNRKDIVIETVVKQQEFPERLDRFTLDVAVRQPRLIVVQRLLNLSSPESETIGSITQGEIAKLEVRVKNTGDMDAQGVKVWVSSERSEIRLDDPGKAFTVGTINAGQTSEAFSITVAVLRSAPAGTAAITVKVYQDEFPEVVQIGKLMVHEEAAEDVKVVGEAARPLRPVMPIPVAANPVVIYSSPPAGGVVQDSFDLVWDIRGDVLSWEVRVNGEVLPGQTNRGIALTAKSDVGVPMRFHEKVPLKSGVNTIEVIAYDLSNERWVDKIQVTRLAEHGEIWAVVIGVSSYRNVPALKYARRDAEAFYKYLTDFMGVPTDHIRTLYDMDVTDRNMRSALGTWLRKNAAKNDTVYIYFAGHGAPEDDPQSEDHDGFEKYLLTVDADPSDLHGTAVPMKYVAEVFGRLNAERVVFIVDSCFSGATGGRTLLAANSTRGAMLSEDFLARLSKGKGRVILSASRANEVSVEDAAYGGGHGVFTFYLLEGLKGAADYNKDAVVDVDELHQYLSKMVPLATGQRQTPVKKGEVEGTLIVGKVK